MTTIAKYKVTATIQSKVNAYQRTLTFLTVPKIAQHIPDQPFDRSRIKIPRNIQLADPDFHRPAPIELLFGSGAALSMLSIGQISLSAPKEPDLYLQKTRLGWVIGGSPPSPAQVHGASCHLSKSLQSEIARFWEIEEGPQRQLYSDADKYCEAHFLQHVSRGSDGRYTVALPFNNKIMQLGESKSQAQRRFISLERKLQRNPALKKDYHAVIKEYLDLGHLMKIPEDTESSRGFYLPHHGVVKTTSETTKLRVVFDGSAATSTGVSLNDALHVGPKIQDDLLYILLRFRIHRYVITGDIEKMYRQFIVRPEDRKYQRILWRDADGEIQTYELQRVTFGLSAAPYLAIRCLSQLAQDEGHRFPEAARILCRDFYVDDALTGASSISEARAIRNQLTQLLSLAGLNIRQWAANHKSILRDLPEQDLNKKLHFGDSPNLKTLGIFWNSSNDSISYEVKAQSPTTRVTKRVIASEIAKIYDPLGLLGPVISTAKMFLQKIWTIKLDWDESLPMNVFTEWSQFYRQLPLLNNIIFPRKTIPCTSTVTELHGFCDASERAYGACVYLRSIDKHGYAHVELLFAKSKVAPLKSQSIPRLELCGALLLTSLITTAKKALHININNTFLWTDSTIVLHWLQASPHTLKTFVANRVTEIQENTRIKDWRHVPTLDNPADLISRGQYPEEFLQPSIWHQGPEWLCKDESSWPTTTLLPLEDIIPEQKTATCLITATLDTSILDNYSSWARMQRIIAYCLRWKKSNNIKGYLTAIEIKNAHNTIIKLLQQAHFAKELRLLSNNNSEIGGKLQYLSPFLDKDGILRVGGRLKHSFIPFPQRHPIILPKSRVTILIIEAEHRAQLHAGVQNTLHAVRRRYWPIDGRNQVWKALRPCTRCLRARPPPVDYIMGDLPAARVTESRPFTHVGVDYCGPFYVKERKHRNRAKIKVYVAVFVCLAVKAVHLEVVSDLTSEAFIAALKRFIARRGFCTNLYSDNGTNFVGANNELKDLRELIRSDDHQKKVTAFLADKAIAWKFIPPRAPHFGGLWEAAVKAFKHHLVRVVGSELFTFEEFNTLIIQIESILNSRPLTPLSSDPNDLSALTPGHFLIGESLTSLRERDFADTPSNRLSTWQHIQKVKRHFWNRWHREYLNELTRRSKWTKGSHSIKEGTIVLIRDDNVPPMHWALGRVLKVHPGSDGIVRTVTIKTATCTLDRAVKRLVPLPQHSEEDDINQVESHITIK
nr:PREDICTED: uncharacterized protein LOC105663276 [Megachile rotundata]